MRKRLINGPLLFCKLLRLCSRLLPCVIFFLPSRVIYLFRGPTDCICSSCPACPSGSTLHNDNEPDGSLVLDICIPVGTGKNHNQKHERLLYLRQSLSLC